MDSHWGVYVRDWGFLVGVCGGRSSRSRFGMAFFGGVADVDETDCVLFHTLACLPKSFSIDT